MMHARPRRLPGRSVPAGLTARTAPALFTVAATSLLFSCKDRENLGDHSEPELSYDSLDDPGAADVGSAASERVFEDPDFRLEVRAPRWCEKTAPFLPAPGHRRLSVPLQVEARTDRTVPVSPLSFHLEDSKGHRFGATLAGCSPALSNEPLSEGESRKGEVAFDVPRGAHDLILSYEPFLIGRKRVLARVRVPAPQP